ncbi:MAG: Molybdate/tungstate transport system permease protein WtpB [Methanocella sp. PtaU1.Bin125]|nr:MAG: Molybdate/tungstate transport system permease protein WtpB [Methanocella sp. PtaU1.Bin125]
MSEKRLAAGAARNWHGAVFASFAVILVYLLVLLFTGLPVLSLFLKISPEAFLSSLGDPVVVEALKLSLITSAASALIVVIVGTPVAYVNARGHYPGKELVDTVIDLPVVLPPAVAGLALLMAFGRRGVLGQYLDVFGVTIAFTTVAVVMAQVFVASPFYIRQARTSFEDVDRSLEHAARTLGASRLRTFFMVTAPVALNGLISGAVLSWARALGEFGATIMFAGNFTGRTRTMPLAIYTAMQGDLDASLALAVIMVIASFAVIAAVKVLSRRRLIVAPD